MARPRARPPAAGRRRAAPEDVAEQTSACARCCSRSRATCASSCCAWRRGCRRCAALRGLAPTLSGDAGARVVAGVRAAGQPAGHLAGQVGTRGPVVSLPPARRLPRRRAPARRDAHRARAPDRAPSAAASPKACTRTASGPRSGAAQTCTASGRRCRGKGLAFANVLDVRALRVIVESLPTVTPRCRGCTRCCRRSRASTTTTSRGPRPTATSRCTPSSARPTASRWKCRSAPARCTSTPSTASPRTGPGRPACAATPASAPAGASTSRSPRRARPCCASCSRGSATSARRPSPGPGGFDDRIYVVTPGRGRRAGGRRDGDRLRLRALHTDLGHRCRGACVDGAMLPLNKPLQNGQTVEIIAAKGGGPSLDWLQRRAGLPENPRSQAKVRAWFNALAQRDDRARPQGSRSCCSARADGAQVRRPGAATGLSQRRRAVRGRRQDELSLRAIENLSPQPGRCRRPTK